MSDEAKPETFVMPLAGRDIEFRYPALGQVLVLERMYHRERNKSKDSDDKAQGVAMTSVLVRTLDFIDTLVVVESDRQYIEDQMLAGTIDWPDVLAVLSGGKGGQDEDDADPKPVKRAPKKSPKAAPVDLTGKKAAQIVSRPATVASRARTKR